MTAGRAVPTRPPGHARRVALAVAAAVPLGCAALYAAFDLLVAASPSDPCSPGHACGPDPAHFAREGLAVGAVALLGLVALRRWFVRWRRYWRFVVPPGWPSAAPGWFPARTWAPPPAWPGAPAGWAFWLSRGQRAEPPFP